MFTHCNIVGEVAREMLRRMPESITSELLPVGSELVAACHDIGKVSPSFVEKILRHTEGYKANSHPALTDIQPSLESNWGGHAGVSQITARAIDVPRYIPEILGQHHGYAPPVEGKRTTDENFWGPCLAGSARGAGCCA